MDIHENIKFVLKKRNMTQKDLADKLGVSKRTTTYYLNGNVTIDTLEKIASALGTTVETLVSETPLHLKDEPIQQRVNTTATKLICPHCGEEITLIAKNA